MKPADQARLIRRAHTSQEALPRYRERRAEVHPDGNLCPDVVPCERCKPLIEGIRRGEDQFSETVQALPKWLVAIAIVLALPRMVWHGAKWLCTGQWAKRAPAGTHRLEG